MINDPFADMRNELAEPLPELFTFDDVDDELFGFVHQAPYLLERENKDPLWQMVVRVGDGALALINLTKDLINKLVRQREVVAGDRVAIRLARIGDNKFREFVVVARPDRPRAASNGKSADEQWFDDSWTPPADDEPAF